MIIHKLLARYFRSRDDADFYIMQAQDSIRWMERVGVDIGPGTEALDLGCGHGIFGVELMKKGCRVTFADAVNELPPNLKSDCFLKVDIDRDDLAKLGKYDLVICSNVFEHLARPERFLANVAHLLKDNGRLYLSWTNWLSPFGGHDFAPLHYLGPRTGRWLRYKFTGQWSKHVPDENLFVTYIGRTLRLLRKSPSLRILKRATRYYTEFSWILRIPVLREFLAWNCALLLAKGSAPAAKDVAR